MKRKVYLEGELGSKFGSEFTMDVSSFGEAIRCLDANFSGFKKYLIEADERGIGFNCQVADAPLMDEKELLLEYSEGDMIISAIPAGSKGAGKFIAGVIIVAATLHFFGPQGFAYLMSAGEAGSLYAATALVVGTSIGLNLAMTGISEMLAPDPSVDNDQDESYLFQGTGQTLIEGDPVPVLYGKLRIPGRPISVQVRNERLNYIDNGTIYADSTADAVNPNVVTPRGGGVPTNPEETENQVFR